MGEVPCSSCFHPPNSHPPPQGPGSRLFGLLSGRRSRDRSRWVSEIPRPTTGGMHETPVNFMGYLIFPISTGDRIPDLLNQQQYHQGENYGENTKYIHIFNHGENGGTLPRVDYEGYHPNNTTIFPMMGGFKNN